MTDLVPFKANDDQPYDEQIKEALEKALQIHGTTLSDLQDAMNCILQMDRALRMVGAPNPYESVMDGLFRKYNMGKRSGAHFHQHARRLLQEGDGGLAEGNSDQLELVEGEAVDE